VLVFLAVGSEVGGILKRGQRWFRFWLSALAAFRSVRFEPAGRFKFLAAVATLDRLFISAVGGQVAG